MKVAPGMEILVLSPIASYPMHFGNRKRIYQQLKSFQERGARITYVYYASTWQCRDYLSEYDLRMMARQWDSFFIVHPTLSESEAQADFHELDEWWDPSLEGFLSWLFSKRSFDTFIVNYVWLSRAFEFCPEDTLKVLDTHDKMSGRKELLARHGIEPEFFYLTEASEKLGLERADLIWAIKEQEADAFQKMVPHCNVMTFPHVENFAQAFPRRQPEDVVTFGIIGALNAINVVNTQHFLEQCLEEIRLRAAPLRICIAGEMCFQLTKYAGEDVQLLGRVDDLESFYEKVDVVLVPLAFSTGMKIKIGEALARGKAVIGHADAFEGYPVTHDYHRLPSMRAIADACCAIAHKPDLVGALEDESRKVKRNWEVVVSSATDKFFTEVVARKKSAIVIPHPDFYQVNSFAYHRLLEVICMAFFQYRVIIVCKDDLPEGFLKRLRGIKKEVYISRTIEAALYHENGAQVLWSYSCCWLMSPELLSDVKSKAPHLPLYLDLVTNDKPTIDDYTNLLAPNDTIVSASLTPEVKFSAKQNVQITSAMKTFWHQALDTAWCLPENGRVIYILAPLPAKNVNQYVKIFNLLRYSHLKLRVVVDQQFQYEIDEMGELVEILTVQEILSDLEILLPKPLCLFQLGPYRSNLFHSLADIIGKYVPCVTIDPESVQAECTPQDLKLSSVATLNQLMRVFCHLYSGTLPNPDPNANAPQWHNLRRAIDSNALKATTNRQLRSPASDSLPQRH